jgi:hypothetical protein
MKVFFQFLEKVPGIVMSSQPFQVGDVFEIPLCARDDREDAQDAMDGYVRRQGGLTNANWKAALNRLRVSAILCNRFLLMLRHAVIEHDIEAIQSDFPVLNRHHPFLADVSDDSLNRCPEFRVHYGEADE